MLKNLYVLIIIIIPIVQIMICETVIDTKLADLAREFDRDAFLKAPIVPVAHPARKPLGSKPRRNDEPTDTKFFDSVVEHSTTSASSKRNAFSTTKRMATTASVQATSELKPPDKSFNEIKNLLVKVLDQISLLKRDENDVQSAARTSSVHESDGLNPDANVASPPFKSTKKKKKDNEGADKRIKWGHWTEWSSCSVSCGKGRQIRWRHCIENCNEAETEMEEKTCQLPACGPGKLFGVIKL